MVARRWPRAAWCCATGTSSRAWRTRATAAVSPLAAVRDLAVLATRGLRPDLIVLVDVPVDVGFARVGRRGAHDRLEAEVREFHDRVRAGYASLRAEEPSRWLQLDGAAPPDVVFEALWSGVVARGLVGEALR